MRQHKHTYGVDFIKPKHHWAFDVAELLCGDDISFDAFIIERIHLRIKAVADNVKSSAGYERSVLSGVINDHARILRESNFANSLRGKTAECPGMPTARISDALEIEGLHVSVGDYVFQDEALGVILACVADSDGALYVVVDSFVLIRRLSAHSARWSTHLATRATWRAASIQDALRWQFDAPGEVVTVRM